MKRFLILLAIFLAEAFTYVVNAQGFDREGIQNFLKKNKHPAKEVITLDAIRMSPPDYRKNVVVLAVFKSVSTDIPRDIAEEYNSIKYKMLNCDSKISGSTLPVVISLKSQKNITEILLDLKEEDVVLLGGKVKTLNLKSKGSSGKSKKDSSKTYVFEVDFLLKVPVELLKLEDSSTDNTEMDDKKSDEKGKQSKQGQDTDQEEENIDFDMDSTEDGKPAKPEKKEDSTTPDESEDDGVEWLD